MKTKPNKLAFINPLRFIGAMIIATVYHYTEHFAPLVTDQNVFLHGPEWLQVYVLDGHLFVEMFYVISGILFFLIYAPKISSGSLGFGQFLKKRLLRMYPLMIFSILFIYVEELVLYAVAGVTWNFTSSIAFRDLVPDIVFGGQGVLGISPTLNGPVWYIGVLMECYIIAFAIQRLVARTGIYGLYGIPLALGCLMNKLQVQSVPFFNIISAQGMTSFFVGIFLGMVLLAYDKADTRGRLCCKGAAVLVLLFGIWAGLSDMWVLMFTQVHYFYLALLFPPIIVLLYDVDVLNRICETRPMAYLGNIAFGIYLWNFPIYCGLILLRSAGLLWGVSPAGWAILEVVVHLIVGVLSYELLEKRFLPRVTGALERTTRGFGMQE